MATTVHESNIIVLLDDTEIKLRPLKISLLREFMVEFGKIDEVAEDNDKSMDILMKCVEIAMKQYAPKLAEKPENLEEILDLPLVYKIVEAASGVQLNEVAALMGSTLK
jgi:hypothetical protein